MSKSLNIFLLFFDLKFCLSTLKKTLEIKTFSSLFIPCESPYNFADLSYEMTMWTFIELYYLKRIFEL